MGLRSLALDVEVGVLLCVCCVHSPGLAPVELFKAQIDYLARSDKYAMPQHLVQLPDSAKAAGLTGWKASLRSSAEQAELENQFAEMKIGEAMTVRGPSASCRPAQQKQC